MTQSVPMCPTQLSQLGISERSLVVLARTHYGLPAIYGTRTDRAAAKKSQQSMRKKGYLDVDFNITETGLAVLTLILITLKGRWTQWNKN